MSAATIQLPERYRVLRHVANGGMASVWEAHDEVLARNVAVKVLAAHLTEDDTARVRFQREARAAAGLSGHTHVVTIYDIGEHAGRSFIVMELMRRSLADLLAEGGPLPAPQALRWLREAASGLDAAHGAGIVHRDVKPANMLLDQRDRLALGDFGIARLAYEARVTVTGTLLGTSSYISPEQALGEPATAASDRYALAVVAFQMLTGEKPFQAEHFAAQARAHIEDPPPSASERIPGLPPAVDDVLKRGMDKDPGARWPSSAAMVAALGDSFETPGAQTGATAAGPAAMPVAIPLDATRPMEPERTPEPQSASGTERAPEPVSERAPGRGVPTEPRPAAGRRPPAADSPPRPAGAASGGHPRRWAAVAVAAALLLLAGVATALILTSVGEQPRETARTERPEPTPTPEPGEPTPDATPEPTPEATATPEPTPATTPAPPAGEAAPDPTAAAPLNDQGFALNRAGSYQQAVEPLARAHALCSGSSDLDPCGYTAYNYGVALNRSGNPDAAIPILEARLERFGDNSDGDVAAELEDARSATGGKGKGKGRGGNARN